MTKELDNKKMWESLYKYGAKYAHFDDAIPDALKDQGFEFNGTKIVPVENKQQRFEIEAGKWYMCIKTWYTDNKSLLFKKGKLYKAEYRGLISELNNNKYCCPLNKYSYEAHFRPATEEEIQHEHKFEVGDWIICCDYEPLQIIGIKTNVYEMSNGDIRPFHMIDNNYYISAWTINDAKDGDVLATLDYILIFKQHLEDNGGVSYCHYDFTANTPHFNWNEDRNWYFGKEAIVHPATKEQCDTLYAKMKEAGYEWDAEHKQLKKIDNEIEIPFGAKDSELQEITYYIPKGFHAEINDDKVVIKKGEKSVAWSEEDEEKVKAMCEDGNLKPSERAWLKSLKPQSTWKPSDEQIEALGNALSLAKNCDEEYSFDLRTLLEQLKAL